MILNKNFYTLVGAIASAIEKIGKDKHLHDTGDKPASGDPHLDTRPGKVGEARNKLIEVHAALLAAETQLRGTLTTAAAAGDDVLRAEAWKTFRLAVTEQSFVFATAVRRLMWKQTGNGPADGTGALEWMDLQPHVRLMLMLWAEVGRGGGGDNAAGEYPGIFGSSAESISF